MPSNSLIKEALGDAYRLHFAKLFTALMSSIASEPIDPALERFFKGLDLANEMHGRITRQLFDEWD